MISPNGEWYGWYFSEELKFARDNGGYAEIEVFKGYKFNRESNVFSDYVNRLYKTKTESVDQIQRNISKSLLNKAVAVYNAKYADKE